MRIAILYSGLIRALDETIHNNLQCFEGANIDLYFSLWDHVGYTDQINAPDNIKAQRTLDKDTEITEEIVRNIVASQANIKKVKIEKYALNRCQFNLTNGLDRAGLSQQFYKVLDCYNLLDNSVNYDAIVRLRCDMLLNNKMPLEDMFQSVTRNKIIFASKIWYNYIWESGIKNINDMIWISNKELMRKACSIYENVDKLNRIIADRKQTILNHGENICYMNLEAENMLDNILTYDFDYQVLR